ncbi:MAG TPA: hypothetical protein VK399_02735 [Longimicrobiaceae bacterium]|nr:hypothetical protein [Longimicrobiaceae bacterium]
MEAACAAAPAEYDARTRRFTFDGGIYGHGSPRGAATSWRTIRGGSPPEQ